jgi:hypothetical protein
MKNKVKKIRLSSCDLGIYLYVVVFAVRLLIKIGRACIEVQTPQPRESVDDEMKR